MRRCAGRGLRWTHARGGLNPHLPPRRWLAHISQNLIGQQQQQQRLGGNDLAADYVILPCAIVRGALAALGLDAAVSADATALPQCDFTVVLRTRQR